MLDSLIWCKFLRKAFHDFYEESAQVYSMVTGWEMTADELRRCGERISNLKKLFNIREGWTRGRRYPAPSGRWKNPLPTGVAAGVGLTKEELDFMIGRLLPGPGLDARRPDTGDINWRNWYY